MPSFRLALPAVAVVAVLTGAATVVLSSQVQRPPARNLPRNSAISGAVSDGATGRALSGVIVSLVGCASLHSVTDSKGRFVFRNLPASDGCYVSAEKQGYMPDGIARRLGLFNQTPLALAENEWIADADFTMWRTGGISGVVLDEKREPVVDVPVRVLTSMPIAGRDYWATGPIARTDDHGRYRIGALLGGRYIVNLPSVQSTVPSGTSQAAIQGQPTAGIVPQGLTPWPGFEIGRSWFVLNGYAVPPPGGRESYPPLYHPNARTIRDAATIDLANSEERRNVDFVVAPVPVWRISGRVEGTPELFDGMIVRLSPDDGSDRAGGHDVATALVASNGTFELVNIPAGRYLLAAGTASNELTSFGPWAATRLPQVPGIGRPDGSSRLSFDTESSIMLLTRLLPGREGHAREILIVGDDDLSGVVLHLRRGPSISGRVIHEDGKDPTSGGSALTLDPADGNPQQQAGFNDRLGSDGTFRVHAPDSGKYFLRSGWPVKSIIAGGIDYTHQPFDLEAGGDVSNVVVTFAAGPGSLSGRVRLSTGQAARAGAVIVFPANRLQWTDFGMNPPNIKTTSSFSTSGYRFPRLPAGEYLVVAVDQAMRSTWHDPRFFPAAAAVATRVTLEWGKPAIQDLVLQRVTLK